MDRVTSVEQAGKAVRGHRRALTGDVTMPAIAGTRRANLAAAPARVTRATNVATDHAHEAVVAETPRALATDGHGLALNTAATDDVPAGAGDTAEHIAQVLCYITLVCVGSWRAAQLHPLRRRAQAWHDGGEWCGRVQIASR